MTGHLLTRETGFAAGFHHLAETIRVAMSKLHQIQFEAPWETRRPNR